MTKDNETIYKEFKLDVNMTKSELKKWLQTDDAKSVGIKSSSKADKKTTSGGEKSKGYESGEQIIKILSKNKSDLTENDYEHMSKVSGYIKRHLKQKPTSEDIKDSRWRYSLMNWGHDPVK